MDAASNSGNNNEFKCTAEETDNKWNKITQFVKSFEAKLDEEWSDFAEEKAALFEKIGETEDLTRQARSLHKTLQENLDDLQKAYKSIAEKYKVWNEYKKELREFKELVLRELLHWTDEWTMHVSDEEKIVVRECVKLYRDALDSVRRKIDRLNRVQKTDSIAVQALRMQYMAFAGNFSQEVRKLNELIKKFTK